MTQNEAMNMSNEQAVQILKPMMDMMRDQHGCPISDAYFAIEKAIHALSTVSPDEFRGMGKWEDVSVHDNIRNIMIASMRCNVCKRYHNEVYHYGNPTEMARFCPVCGAKMEVSDDA